VPQLPQLFTSVIVSMHCPPQSVFVPQFNVHVPPEQTLPLPQAMPQPPQLFGSDAQLTQALPQRL
jgi:hypothetical protein